MTSLDFLNSALNRLKSGALNDGIYGRRSEVSSNFWIISNVNSRSFYVCNIKKGQRPYLTQQRRKKNTCKNITTFNLQKLLFRYSIGLDIFCDFYIFLNLRWAAVNQKILIFLFCYICRYTCLCWNYFLLILDIPFDKMCQCIFSPLNLMGIKFHILP